VESDAGDDERAEERDCPIRIDRPAGGIDDWKDELCATRQPGT
jgi:hypothetical protein